MAYKRLLVIANETIAGSALHAHIRELTGEGGRVIIVTPALSSRLEYVLSDVDEPRVHARERLDASLEALRKSGIDAEGEVGDVSPVRAAEDSIAIFDPDAILVSTHPEGRSHWLEHGVIEKIRSKTDLPVEHVIVDLEAQGAEAKLAS